MKVLGGFKRGLAFVVSGPSAAGKTTLVGMLCKEFDCIVKSISYTTRAPRANETHGVDYFFISVDEFEKKIRNQEFLEYAKVFGQYYGTSKKWVEEQEKEGQHVILVIDTQGALQLMEAFKAAFIFISSPSIDELRNRMTFRKSETKGTIEQRLSWAEKEMAVSYRYNYTIVNEELNIAYQVLKSILIAEEHKNH